MTSFLALWMKQEHYIHQELDDYKLWDTAEFTMSSDIEEDSLNHQQGVQHVGQVCQGKTWLTTSVSLQKEWSRANSVIAQPPLCYS